MLWVFFPSKTRTFNFWVDVNVSKYSLSCLFPENSKNQHGLLGCGGEREVGKTPFPGHQMEQSSNSQTQHQIFQQKEEI